MALCYALRPWLVVGFNCMGSVYYEQSIVVLLDFHMPQACLFPTRMQVWVASERVWCMDLLARSR